MKKIVLILLSVIVFASCEKQKTEAITEQQATVTLIKYACGLAFDATVYSIKMEGKDVYYVPDRLPDAFKIDGLQVKISFRKTGQFPAAFQGPPHEIINLVTINLQ